jgi:hypothetical protein
MRTMSDLVAHSYATRQCFICERLGPCRHREFDVEVAYLLRVPKIGPRMAEMASPALAPPAQTCAAGGRG